MGPNRVERSGKLLIVYYSFTGNTARVAWDLAKLTKADVESLGVPYHRAGLLGAVKAVLAAVLPRTVQLGELKYDPRDYSLVIVGSPVWIERMNPAIRSYLQRFANELPHVGFFVTSGRTDVARICPSVERILGHGVDASAGFTEQDLADPRQYDAKLVRFLETLHRLPAMRVREPKSACCP